MPAREMPSILAVEALSEAVCLLRLACTQVGRVATTIRATPAIFPVNYAVLDEDVVFRTGEGTKFDAALSRAVVAFEIDGSHEGGRGWSVLVIGRAREITDRATEARADSLGLQTWAPGERKHYIRIDTDIISGRRVIAVDAVIAPSPASLAGAGS